MIVMLHDWTGPRWPYILPSIVLVTLNFIDFVIVVSNKAEDLLVLVVTISEHRRLLAFSHRLPNKVFVRFGRVSSMTSVTPTISFLLETRLHQNLNFPDDFLQFSNHNMCT